MQDQLLLDGHKKFGNRWTEIAKMVQGRTDNAVKNRFAVLVRKQASRSGRGRAGPAPGVRRPQVPEPGLMLLASHAQVQAKPEKVRGKKRSKPEKDGDAPPAAPAATSAAAPEKAGCARATRPHAGRRLRRSHRTCAASA